VLWGYRGGGPAGLARKPERSAAQGMRDSNTTGLSCGLLCSGATGGRPAGLARKPERSAAQGMRDSNTTGLSCGLLCSGATGGRPAGLARKPERSAAQGERDSNTTGLPCGLLCFGATGGAGLRVKPESLNDPQHKACGIRIPQACPVDCCALGLQGGRPAGLAVDSDQELSHIYGLAGVAGG